MSLVFGPVTAEMTEAVLVIRFDDGKANVLNRGALNGFQEAFGAFKEARSACIIGRAGFFCAGYDLAEMTASNASARDLSRQGRSFLTKLLLTEIPTVIGVTGHALAAGAAMVLTGDVRVGADGPFSIGFPEVSRGMALSQLSVELAARRLSPGVVERVLLESELCQPRRALEFGYLDSVVQAEDVEAEALGRALRLARPDRAAVLTKVRLRSARRVSGHSR